MTTLPTTRIEADICLLIIFVFILFLFLMHRNEVMEKKIDKLLEKKKEGEQPKQ